MSLEAFGWDAALARDWEAWAGRPHVEPGRVVIEFNYLYRVRTAEGEFDAVLAGSLKHRAAGRAELPAVGDWVALRRRPDEDRGAIVAVLPRRSRFSRRAAGQGTDEQVVAANVDVVFVVMGLDEDFSLRRLERYLLLAHESGAAPVVLLTKPDVSREPEARIAETKTRAGRAPVHVLNPKTGEGLEPVFGYLPPGRTAALIGSSGVGKSTIINRLLGAEIRKTREVRESDSKGRHTTTHRELIVLPGGGLVIDTPGMRELQLWDASDGIRDTFEDVLAFAHECRFADCRHRDEPRCAVKAAVAEGRLTAARLESYLKLQDELAQLAKAQEERAQGETKRRARPDVKSGRKPIRSHNS